jgi:hypothetical protein
MSNLVPLSPSDSFNATNGGPGNPANVNWKMIAIHGGIALGSTLVFVLAINHSNKQTSERWRLQVKSMNESHLASL